MDLYERFHRKRRSQRRLLNKDDFTYQYLLSKVLKYGKDAKTVLDIGCGVGTVDFFLGKLGKSIYGIDISKKAVLIATSDANLLGVAGNVRFNVLEFPGKLPREKFDLIICSEILEHLKDDNYAVSQMKKLLNPRGIIIASSPSKKAPLYRMGLLKRFDKEVGHLRRYSEQEFKEMFIRNGLKILKFDKTEGVLRNFLFTNSLGGVMLKVLNKKPFSFFITLIDEKLVKLFGESDLQIVATKK